MISADANDEMGGILRVALFGAGRHAQHHARAIMRCAGVRLVAVADPSQEATTAMRAISPGVQTYDSPDDLLETERPDVVHICTPPGSHAALAAKALKSGSHIYVEKPFADSVGEAEQILSLASETDRSVCAGHQLLFESPSLQLARHLPALGKVVHVESYFSFRTVRHAPGGRRVLRADHQLLDILPHPVYLLLHALEQAATGRVSIVSLRVSRGGTVHALVERGDVTGVLTVTLEGRPVESYLRVIGGNGSVFADFVRGTTQRCIGPGSSAIDKLLAPYRLAWQLFTQTTVSTLRRVLRRQTSYAGLTEIFSAFYGSIREGRAAPLSHESLLDTVRICQRVAEEFRVAEMRVLEASVPRSADARVVLVTGGTGVLGREVVRSLLARGRAVRVVSRRAPSPWDRLAGVEYAEADLAADFPAAILAGVECVIHAAAETAGGWKEHQRNSIDATERVLRAAGVAGVTRFIQVSSVAVLAQAGRASIGDDHPLAADSRAAGPYVWGKLESERLAETKGPMLGVAVKIVRPGPIVNAANFEAPGRLGKRIGNIFVAVGSPSDRLAIVDAAFAGRFLAWAVDEWEQVPAKLNLIGPQSPSKRDLITIMRRSNPDLTVVWLPSLILRPLSWFATLVQKVLRPRTTAIDVAKPFAVIRYDPATIARLAARMEAGK